MATTARTELSLRVLGAVAIAAFVLMMVGPPAGMLWYVHRANALMDDGNVATGVVVSGECGQDMSNDFYCGEKVRFEDHHGVAHTVSRACGTSPHIGQAVTIHYDAANPTTAQVGDDDRLWQFHVGLFMYAVFFVWMSYRWLTRKPPQPKVIW